MSSIRSKLSIIGIMYRLRELRKERGWTQIQVAKMLGMSQNGYSKYETGENDIPTKILVELAKIYSVTVDFILELED